MKKTSKKTEPAVIGGDIWSEYSVVIKLTYTLRTPFSLSEESLEDARKRHNYVLDEESKFLLRNKDVLCNNLKNNPYTVDIIKGSEIIKHIKEDAK